MKKLIAVIITFAFLLSLAACAAGGTVKPTDAPTAEPTAAPETTAEPEEPTEEPAEQNTPVPEGLVGVEDYFVVLEKNKAVNVDLNFDGQEETVILSEGALEYGEFESMLTVTFGGSNASVFSYKVNYSYGVTAWIMDCDPTDSKLDVVLSYCQDSDDWTSAAFRVNNEANGMDTFEDYCGIIIPDGYAYSSEEGFPIFTRTDILGTTDVNAYYTVTEEGFKLVSPYYTYPVYDDGWRDLELVRELELELVDENCEPTGEKITVPVGGIVTPYATDLESWVCVKLEDGRIGRAEVSFPTDELEWGIYINGVSQDEYAQIPYAD